MSESPSRGCKPDPGTLDCTRASIPREWLLDICRSTEALAAPVQAFLAGTADAAGVVEVLFQSLHRNICLHKPIPDKHAAVAEAFRVIESLCQTIDEGQEGDRLFAQFAELVTAGERLRAAVDAVPVNILSEAIEWHDTAITAPVQQPLVASGGNGQRQLKASEFQLGEFLIEELTRIEKDLLICFWGNGSLPRVDKHRIRDEVYGEEGRKVKAATLDTHRKNLARKVLVYTDGAWAIRATRFKTAEYHLVELSPSV